MCIKMGMSGTWITQTVQKKNKTLFVHQKKHMSHAQHANFIIWCQNPPKQCNQRPKLQKNNISRSKTRKPVLFPCCHPTMPQNSSETSSLRVPNRSRTGRERVRERVPRNGPRTGYEPVPNGSRKAFSIKMRKLSKTTQSFLICVVFIVLYETFSNMHLFEQFCANLASCRTFQAHLGLFCFLLVCTLPEIELNLRIFLHECPKAGKIRHQRKVVFATMHL